MHHDTGMPIRFANTPGLVVYLTVGDPDLETTYNVALEALDAGADVLELGVPFSDPVADGPVIERASQRAVARGVRLLDVLELCRRIHAVRPDAGLIVFSYINPLLRYGLARFTAEAAAAGVDGVLVTDLIVEEAAEYLELMKAQGLAPVFLAAPTSTDTRLEAIAANSQGFIYAISRVGITGTRQQLASSARELVSRLRRWSKLPIAVGFGVSTAAHVAELGEFADAAVIGSAIVELIERSTAEDAPGEVARFIKGLRQGVPALTR